MFSLVYRPRALVNLRQIKPLLLSVCLLLALVPSLAFAEAAHCRPGQAPDLMMGFGPLKAELGETFGEPVECEHVDPVSGDVLQQTTKGLAYYRKATNMPTFTDGYTRWAITASGIVSWEGEEDPISYLVVGPTPTSTNPDEPIVAPPSFASTAVATRTSDGWATVSGVSGPEIAVVTNARGERLSIWHIGVIGPTNDSAGTRAAATRAHAALLPPGTRVWVAAHPGLDAAEGGALLRHAYLGDQRLPVGAELLRKGAVWVYPHAMHEHAADYTIAQADAVNARLGAWQAAASTLTFKPSGIIEGGFPTSTRVVPILRALDRSEQGHTLLMSLLSFPTEIGLATLPDGMLGVFVPRLFSVQLSDSLLSAPTESVAAVLLHELVHSRQMIDRGINGRAIDCYGDEEEAFVQQSAYWAALYGANGKPNATHPLDRELNLTLRQYNRQTLGERVHASYGHQCEAAAA